MPPILRHVNEPPGTWLPSPTREPSAGAATGWSPSWAWQPPRSWPERGRSQRSPNGPPTPPSRSAPRSAPASRPPAASPSRPRRPSVARSRLDADALAGAIGAWLADRKPQGPAASRRRAVAVDGKTLRGALGAGGDGRPVHLLAAMDHASRTVLAQRQVGGAPEEVPAFAPLLAPLDLTGVVITTDALQTHPEAAEFLVGVKQAHYLLVVKANQPTLLDRCARLPWHRVPGRRPHPRPRPRPRRAAQPQGRQRPPLRVPARRPGPHRRRPHRHGGLAEPGRRRAQPGRAAQRRRATPPRPRPLPTPGHPGNQPRMNPTSRHNDGPWVAATCARGSCMRHRQALRSRGWSRVRIALPSIWPGLGQDLDVPVGSVHADPLPIPDHPGGIYHTDDGRQAVLPCDHCAVSHQSSDLRH
jgi:hypothetical protein